MRKRLSVLVGLSLAGFLGLLVWRAPRSREPVFEGRALTSWLNHHVASSDATPPYGSPGWKKADEALRSIGTNGIPTLLQMIRAKDPPPLVLKLLLLAGRYPWTRIHYRYAEPRNEEAEYAFEILGTNAVSAVPALIEIYEQGVSPLSQSCASLALAHIGPGAQAALPALIRRFTHTNDEVRSDAVRAVTHIGGEDRVLMPALTRALKDSYLNVRWNALNGLSRFGSRARSAVPEILKMMNDPGMLGSESITQQVATALWRIAPEKVGKPLVVEDSTPMIANGLTTEALKVVFHDELVTVIRAGTPVPTVRQHSSSDPRPSLRLYRGGDAPKAEPHFLGEFEVMELPASDDLNVSTLYVIANGQIILCARNNHGDRFLEIRRVQNGDGK